MASIHPFKISISDADLKRLHQKLDLANYPGPMDGEERGEYGATVADVERLTKYWNKGYDWRKHEAELNHLHHFKTAVEIDGFGGLGMHFVHERSEVKGAIPLLFVHGWPGSFYEASKLIPLLTNPENDDDPAFHVVVPSLPNFGFSERVSKKNFGVPQYAESVHKIMLALGYNEYVTQGGDWGFLITRALCHIYPSSVKAMHTNWNMSSFPSFLSSPLLFTTSILKFASALPYIGPLLQSTLPPSTVYTPAELTALARAKDLYQGEGRGYWTLLGSKPMSVAFSWNDSPVGLLAFLWEKLAAWSDDYPWTDDEILTWISIYWFSTAGPGASGVIYKDCVKDLSPGGKWTMAKLQSRVSQPVGVAFLRKECANMPRDWANGLGRVVYVGDHEKDGERGGHFGAWERPDAIAGDLRGMFGRGGGAFGAVRGAEGY